MYWLLAPFAAAQEPAAPSAPAGCSHTSIARLSRLSAPAVVILGERKGAARDLRRARSLVRMLAEREPVTVAVQAVRESDQAALDRFAAGELTATDLRGVLDWDRAWGFPYEPYARLFSLAGDRVRLRGIGASYSLPEETSEVAVPPGYLAVLADPMGESRVPPAFEERFPRFVAFNDAEFARRALAGWSGEGVLVLIVDRYHVEGGLGVQWQAAHLTDSPVHSALLADADSRCYAGDQIVSFLAL